MTWRDDLRKVTIGGRQLIGASFRGVPFFVETVERSGGRRAVVHEFPLRDAPFVEDLGRSSRGLRVDGYVIGDDYLAQRDALLTALEDTDGPGSLVIPYYGTFRAICMRLGVRESRAEGGVAMFSIEFAETPAQEPTPTEVVDSVGQVAAGADAAVTAADAELVEDFDPSGLPAFALESASDALTKVSETLRDKLAPIIKSTQILADVNGRISSLTAQASSLVREPADIIGEFRSVITALGETALEAPGAVLTAFYETYLEDITTAIAATTATRQRELDNQTALVAGLRRILAIEAARLAPLAEYASIEEALDARDQVADMLEEQAKTAGDTAYPSLVDLRSEVLRAVPGGRTFARVVKISRSAPVPSLFLAYQLYGSVDLEMDVIARNGIRHPGFVVGELKVLSDE